MFYALLILFGGGLLVDHWFGWVGLAAIAAIYGPMYVFSVIGRALEWWD